LKRGLFEARTSVAHPVHRDFRLRHDDGEYRWIQMNASHEFDETGKLMRMLGTNVDVTEIKRLEVEFEQAQKLESIGRLAGGVAHDFNNLLSVIGGYTEMAIAMLEEGTPLHKDLMQVKRASDRAAGLTRQLLAFSRRQLLSPEVLNLNTITLEAEKMLRRLIGEDIDLRVEPGENLGQVMADPGQMEQVLLNLAVNARDAMPGGGQLTISTANLDLDAPSDRLHCRVPPGRYVRMSVCDSGCGMTQEVLGKIFEPFFTTKEQGKGTGLGLATVYGIVKQSGGYISANSRPGEGACFEIFLPRIDTSEAAQAQEASPEIPRGSECILVVEDEEVLRSLAQRLLEPLGYTVQCACSGAEAIDLIAQGKCRPDLLLTDVIMPGMSGPDLAERITLTHPEIKVVYMSGYTDDQLDHHGVLKEGTLLVQKPFTARQLTTKVREALDGTKPAR
jgi:signal transduction histidine kinase/CheY-like chemotaxis protein